MVFAVPRHSDSTSGFNRLGHRDGGGASIQSFNKRHSAERHARPLRERGKRVQDIQQPDRVADIRNAEVEKKHQRRRMDALELVLMIRCPASVFLGRSQVSCFRSTLRTVRITSNLSQGYQADPQKWSILRIGRKRDSLSRLFATRVRVTIGDDKRGTVHVNYGETFETRPAVIVAVDTSYPHLWSAGASNNTVTGCDVTVVSASDSAGVSVWVCLIAAEF